MLTTAQRSKAQYNAYNNATHQRRQQRRQRNRQQPSTAFAQHSRVLPRSLCESGPRAGMRSSHADTAHSLSSPAQFKSEQSIEEGR